MSSQPPPNLPEALPAEPSQTSIVEAPPADLAQPVPTTRRGCSGFGCALGGAFGCLAVLIIPIVILLLAGTISLNSIVSNVRDIFNPPVTITASIVLERVTAMSQLTTVRYNYSSLVTAQQDMPPVLAILYGNKQVMVAVGHINAGIDLSQLTAANVVMLGNTLTVTLPAPRLQDCFLNDQESYIMSQETGIFANEMPNMTTDARRYALEQFRNSALESGILDEANAQAQATISDLLKATAGDVIIEVVITPPDPNAPLPPTCE